MIKSVATEDVDVSIGSDVDMEGNYSQTVRDECEEGRSHCAQFISNKRYICILICKHRYIQICTYRLR